MPQEAAPGLSEPQRIVNTFIAPSKTFADIRRNASWWVPWLIGAVLLTSTSLLINKKVDLESMVREQIAARSGPAFESLSKEQQAQQVAFGMRIARITPYLLPVGGLIFGLIIAVILMAAFNFIHEAAVPYGRSLAIFFYAGLPTIISLILTMITLAVGTNIEDRNPRNLVATNPAYFMDYHTSKFLYGMVESLDVITIWVIVLVGTGFKINSAKPKLSMGASIGTVASLYLVWRLIASSLGWV